VERDEGTSEVRFNRTNEDKRRDVIKFFEDHPDTDLSNREIARQCGVSEYLVRDIRQELKPVNLVPETTEPEPAKPILDEVEPKPTQTEKTETETVAIDSEPEPEQSPIEDEKPETDGDGVVGADHPLQIILGATADVAARMFAESVSSLPAEPEDEELSFMGNDTESEYLARLADEDDEEQDDHSPASHDLSQKQRFDLIDEGIVDPDDESDGCEFSQKQTFDAIDAGIIPIEDDEEEPDEMPDEEPAKSQQEQFEAYLERTAKRERKEQERELRRDENRQKIAQTQTIDEALGTARFATIVIDPPWSWDDEGDADQFGRARPTYGTMSNEELLALPVDKFADTDCHLYLWITNRSLPKGFQLLESWGFRYVTCITWVKPSFGMGNYFRGQTEHLLFGVKGSQMLKRHDVGTVLQAPRGPKGHSSKPIESYDLIESCSPGPYLELFARSQRPDWTSWGADA
jgi:N6-adenosine-specific RNA methylase IME4